MNAIEDDQTSRKSTPAPLLGIESLSELAAVDFFNGNDALSYKDVAADNAKCAGWAADALLTMARRTGLLSDRNNAKISTAIGDLLGNLAHLCDATGLDIYDLLADGMRNHDEELFGR